MPIEYWGASPPGASISFEVRGDESRDRKSFADFSLALSYIILKCKFWTPGEGDGPLTCPWSIQFESDISGQHTFTGLHV